MKVVDDYSLCSLFRTRRLVADDDVAAATAATREIRHLHAHALW